MPYFEDLIVVTGKHMPGCRVHVDSDFPDTYTVEYVHAGKLYWQVDDHPRAILDRPALFWHMPGARYRYGPADSGGWDHHYLLLQGPRGRRLVREGFGALSAQGYRFTSRPEEVREIFLRILGRLHEATPAAQAEAGLAVERLLHIAAFAPPPGAESDRRERVLRKLAERMRTAPFAAYDPDALAREMHVSTGHFRRLFRDFLRKSFHNHLLHCRMRRSAEWLEEPDTPVKEVAFRAGYEDGAQFSKAFKKQIGLSPRQYREAILRGGTRDEGG